jgi:MFS family permease
VIQGPKSGWASPLILALFAIAAIGTYTFVRYERRSDDPMMDVMLFRDPAYAVAIGTICAVFFSIYGMLLITTQFLQNVRGYSPEQTGIVILPFSASVTIVSPLVGHIVGRWGARPPILAGLATMVLGLVALIAAGQGSVATVLAGLGLCGIGGALCLTPITTLAMTSVPAQRAGMASGIMSAQRAIGSTVGFAVLGSVLAAWLAATLEQDLVTVIANRDERAAVASAIVASANPRAHVAEIGPRQPISHPDESVRRAIVAVAERDFIAGIRVALGVAIGLLLLVLVIGWRYFPRGHDAMMSDAEREAAKLATSEQ